MDTPQPTTTDRSNPHSLFYLPDELLVQVVSHLAADKQTLCTLACTCRFFQIEAEKYIYSNIELLSTNDLHAIIEAFTRRPERIVSVETLKILYRFHNGLGATAEERSVFNRCVRVMKALRHWEIESPYDNYKWDEGGDEWVLGDMEEFRKALETASLKAEGRTVTVPSDVGLAKLERLTIHTHGVSDDFWNLGGFHCLFRHPSLRYLHVSCLALPSDLPELEPYARSTPLNELVFDECELEQKSLGRILATPKNLRRLTLGENVYNINEGRGANPRLTRAPESSLAALKHVAHSLESLTHYDPAWKLDVNYHKHTPIAGDGMRDFHSLTSLKVDACSFLYRSIVLSHTQAPPNLNTLQVRHPRPRVTRFGFSGASIHEDFFERLPPYEPYTYLASLKTLDFVQGASLEMPIAKQTHIGEAGSIRERHALGYKLHKHGINLKVTLEATWRRSLIPPVLHGEPPPELICMYNAEEVGFRREADRELGQELSRLEELPETDQLTDFRVKVINCEVSRKLNALWNRMRRANADDDDDGPNFFTVVIDSDDDMWDELDDEADDLDDEWHDAEEHDVEYELDLSALDEGELDEEDLVELQAQALLSVAAAVEDVTGMDQLTEDDDDGVD